MSEQPIIVWFRNDLRLTDNLAVARAVEAGAPIIALYIRQPSGGGKRTLGGASKWWLHHSLQGLKADISKAGARLVLRTGKPNDVLTALASETEAKCVHITRQYDPHAVSLESDLKNSLEKKGITLRRYPGALLCEPEDIETQNGDPYKVYSPFWRALNARGKPRKPVAAPEKLKAPENNSIESEDLDDWGLLPTSPNWAEGFEKEWQPGEAGARKRLAAFLDDEIGGYKENRNRPDMRATSRLSPHLHFGEISPNAVWYATLTDEEAGMGLTKAGARNSASDADRETFLKELVWREFSMHLLFHFPTLPSEPFRPEYANFPWRDDDDALKAWQKGNTGYPIVDAGMRELWTTGWMHNRVRMVVASFLIKHLLIHWRHGEAWFWDTLVDADLANNAASWQWVAGSGADAAPYFRIFNPISQGQKFDPNGDYVRKWVPEIAKLPDKVLHAPWEADADTLREAGITLGKTYPAPMVDHPEARERALAGYEEVKKSA